jgi:hypothetical protein
VPASGGNYGNIAAGVGGGTLSYGAMAWRFLGRRTSACAPRTAQRNAARSRIGLLLRRSRAILHQGRMGEACPAKQEQTPSSHRASSLIRCRRCRSTERRRYSRPQLGSWIAIRFRSTEARHVSPVRTASASPAR